MPWFSRLCLLVALTGCPAPDPGDATDTSDETDTSDAVPTGDTGTSPTPTPPASCEGETCSDHGTCAVLGATTTCVCDPGYGPIGMRCVPCDQIGPDELVVDVPSVRLRGTFTIDGAPPPSSVYEQAEIRLESREHGVVLLGRTHLGGFDAQVMPGEYDVTYRHVLGAALPRNQHAHLGTLAVFEPAEITIDVPSVSARGAFLVDGQPAPDSDYENGEIWFVLPEIDDEVLVGRTRDQTFDLRVVPGDYDVRFRRILGGNVVPAVPDGFVQTFPISFDTVADIDIETVILAGVFTLDGEDPPDSDYETGDVYLVGDGGPPIWLGETRDRQFNRRILPGKYDVYFQRKLGGQLVPRNAWGLVETNLTITGHSVRSIDLVTHLLEARVAMNGAGVPLTAEGNGDILARTEAGDEVRLGRLVGDALEARLLEGTYDIVYEVTEVGADVPDNPRAHLGRVRLTGDTNELIAFNTATITGDVLLNGAQAPADPSELGSLFAVDAHGDTVTLGFTPYGLGAHVISGSYDVRYSHILGSGTLPYNHQATVDTLDLARVTAATLTPDLRAVRLSGSILVSGEGPASTDGRGTLTAHDAGDDVVLFGDTSLGAFETTLLEGVYELRYDHEAPGGRVPRNVGGRVTCFRARD